MSKNIEQHVVDMRFENKEFEKGVGKSLTTIEKLKKSLDFKGMSRGLTSVSDSANKIDFAGAVRGVETLKNRISIMGAIGFAVIQNIANKLIDLGRSAAQTLVFEPILSGFSEYETQINAIQTILANTAKAGTTLDQVSDALGLLNTYADQTIYNFTEMTRNIGTFTAAGVDLDTSVAAIKGIANVAAVSGSNSQQAATAMYQLSQALASGTVRLQDWMSVEKAGLGGMILQESLMETARVHGIAIDKMLEDEGSFRATLKSGWLSSEILTDTLEKFTGDLDEATLLQKGYTETQAQEIIKLGKMANDAATKVKTFTQLGEALKEAAQSGWTRSWELIIGDFEQAKAFLTKVSDTMGALIGQSADARNELLTEWAELGGRSYMLDNLWAAFYNLLGIMEPIKEAFKEVFPPITAQTLLNLTIGLGKLIDKFKMGVVGSAKLKAIFRGLFSILDIGRLAITAVIKAIFPLGENLSGLGGKITDVIVPVAKYISTLQETIKVNDTFTKAIAKVITTLEPFYRGILAFIDSIKTKLREFKGLDFGPIKEFFSSLMKFDITPIKEALDKLTEGFGGLSLATKVSKFNLEPIKDFFQGIINSIAGIDLSLVLQAISTGFGGALVLAITNWLKLLGETVKGLATGGVVLALTKYLQSIAKIADNVANAVDNVSEILDGVGGVLKGYQNELNAKALKNIAIAIAILALSLFLISTINPDKLTAGLAGLSALLVELFLTMKAFTGSSSVNLTTLSLGLIGISVALLILSGALKNIAALTEEELRNSVLAVTAFLTGLVVAMRVMSNASGDIVRGSAAMSLISIALRLLTTSVRKLGEMDIEVLKQGILGIGGLLLSLAAFTRLAGGPDNIVSIAVAIGILGGSLLIIAKSAEVFGSMDIDILKQGLQGMGAALLIVAIATQSLPGDMLAKAVGLVIVGGALLILAEALQMMGELEVDELEIALAALGISLLILVAALQAMSGSLGGAAALLVAAGALFVLANALMLLGSMSINEIGLALLALGGFLIIFGLAGLILGPMVPVLMALGGALVLFGAAALLVGLGVAVLASGLAVLAVGGGAAIGVLILALSGIIALIPYLVQQLGVALIALIQVIADAAPKLVEAIVIILKSLIKGFVEIIPQLVSAILDLMTTLLQAIAEKIPDILQAGFDILLALLQGIADNIGGVVTTVADIVIAFLDALGKKLPEIVQAGFEFLIAFFDGLTLAIEDNLPRLIESFYNMGKALLTGLVEGLGDQVADVLISVKRIAQQILNGFLKAWGIKSASTETMDMAKYLMLGITSGINKFGGNAINAASKMGNDLVVALSDATSTIGDILDSDLVFSPIITPVLDLADFTEGTNVMSNAMDGLDTTVAALTAGSVRVNDPDGSSSQDPVTPESGINFTQYNNSPKALSRLEIYRQTRLLLEAA